MRVYYPYEDDNGKDLGGSYRMYCERCKDGIVGDFQLDATEGDDG